ncbi:hypothetical protein ABPG72_003913 [Tetrahymena utriculariae]
MNFKSDFAQKLQDKVYEILNEEKQYMYKGQKIFIYKTFQFEREGAYFYFLVDIEAEKKSSFTYDGIIYASVTFPNGLKKSDTIKLNQSEIIEKKGIFSRIWSWIKIFF